MTKIEEQRQAALKAELEKARAIHEQIEDEMEGTFGVSCVKVDVDWEDLLEDVDFQGKTWYLRDENGDWQEVAVSKIYDILNSMDITDQAEIAWVMRCFRDRDKKTNRIEHDPEKRKQQQERDARNRERVEAQFAKAQKLKQQGRQQELW